MTTPQQQPEDWTTLKVTRTYSEVSPSRIEFLQGAEPFLVVENPTPQQLHFSRRVAATWSACAGLSDPAAAITAAREALEGLLPLGLCGCDDQEDKETGAHPSESSLGNTAFDGTPIWGEPCKYCKARTALQQLNGEAQP